MNEGRARHSAFHGDAEAKARLLARVRTRWDAGQLVPDTALNWQADGQPDSLAGALGATRDRATFERETGIPVDLAMVCEALLVPVISKTASDDAAGAAVATGTPAILAFGMEWLDAIRPGADLGPVVPQFARHCLSLMLQADFELAPHITPAFRDVATQIAALWDHELAGQPVSREAWRNVRRAAIDANAISAPIWGYRVATLLEAIAWPAESVAGEFVGHFALFLLSWLMHVETAEMTAQERIDREHLLVGWRAMATAPRDAAGAIAVDPLADLPESQRVTAPDHIMATMARSAALRLAARPRKERVVRDLMNRLLTLIRAA